MPVSFSSPPRNLFLLGSSGADVVRNFFHEVNTSSSQDVYIPDEIRYDYGSDRYFLAGTAQNNNSNNSNNKKFGWIERRDYDADLDSNPPSPSSSTEWSVKIEDTNGQNTANIDTTLRAMESYGNELVVVGKTGNVPWIAKYNNNGGIVWSSTSNTADVEYTGVCKGGTNYYACGSTAVSGDAVSFVEKFDSNGNPGWGKSATMLGRDVVLEKITANSRDEIIAVGYLEDDTADKGYIVKIDANSGEILWDRSLERNISGSGNSGGNGNDDIASADVRCTACYIDGNDQIYVVGSIDGKSPVNNGVGEFLIKYSPEGNILWQRENHTDHYTALDGAPNMIPFDVKSDTDTQQTVVLSVENQGSFASNNSDIFISKYSKDGTLVFRRKISKGSNTLGNASLDADPSFYYVLFTDQQTVPISGTPDRYFFGKVSTSGNGLGNFQYDDGGSTPVDYTIVTNAENKIGRLSDGSVRNDISDFITYPFTANKLVFDDLATPVSNKKKQMDSADSFLYSGSPSIRHADHPKLWIGSEEKVVAGTASSDPEHWHVSYSDNSSSLDSHDIALDSSNNVYICGTYGSPNRAYLAKWNSDGVFQWQKYIQDTSLAFYGIAIDSSDNILVSGTSSGIQPGESFSNFRMLTVKYNSSGVKQWDRELTSVASGGSGGQQEFTTPGTYTFTVPSGVTSVCVVCVGAGGSGGAYGAGGGSLAYKNNISVTPGQTHTVVVGATNSTTDQWGGLANTTAGNSSVLGTVAYGGYGGNIASGGSPGIGVNYDGGGQGGGRSTDFYQGGIGYKAGSGGGAGGYSGSGGSAGYGVNAGNNGTGGGGGGGASGPGSDSCGGGGVGIYGEGTSGSGGVSAYNGGSGGGAGGSGGTDGFVSQTGSNGDSGGGLYGGGGGGGNNSPRSSTSSGGAVRIIWGAGRAFPSSNTADATSQPESDQKGFAIDVDQSGNSYNLGYTDHYQDANAPTGNQDWMLLAKYNSSGTLQWQRWLRAGAYLDRGHAISVNQQTSEVYIVGIAYDRPGTFGGTTNAGSGFASGESPLGSSGNNNSDDDILVAKYDYLGNLIWTRIIGSDHGDASITDRIYDIKSIGNGGDVWVATEIGQSSSNSSPSGMGSGDIMLTKFNSSGTEVWSRVVGSTSTLEQIRGLDVDSSGNAYVLGVTGNGLTPSTWDMVILKFNTSGTLQWQRTLSGSELESYAGASIKVDDSDNFYITFTTETPSSGGNSSVKIFKLPTDGTFTDTHGDFVYAASSFNDVSRTSFGTSTYNSTDAIEINVATAVSSNANHQDFAAQTFQLEGSDTLTEVKNNIPAGTPSVTFAVDMAGNGLDSIVEGATRDVFQEGFNHWEFDGANDYIQLPTNSDLTFTGDFSYETWLWTDVQPASNTIWSTPGDQTFQFTTLNGVPQIVYYSPNTANQSFGQLSNNSWAHYVITKSGNTLTGYKDGEQEWTNTPGSSLTHDFSGLGIGYRTISPANQFYWDGRMGEIRIYSRCLTPTAVLQNYNATKIKYENAFSNIGVTIGPGLTNQANQFIKAYYDFSNKACWDDSENWIDNSNLNGSNWTVTNVTKEANADIMAPDGTKTATLITETDVNNFHFIEKGIATTGARTFSVYLKAGTTNRATLFMTQGGNNGAKFNLETGQMLEVFGAGNTAAIEDVGGGWYRCSIANDGVAGTIDNRVRVGILNGAVTSVPFTGASIYVWGPQLERRLESPPLAGRYLPRHQTTKTREITIRNLSPASSGSKNNATRSGGQGELITNRGGYLVFDGVNNYLTVNGTTGIQLTESTLGSGWAVEGWFKFPDPATNNASGTWNYLFRLSPATSGGPNYEVGMFGTGNNFSIKDNGTSQQNISCTITPNTWHFICLGQNSVGKLFLKNSNADGSFTTTESTSAATSGDPDPLVKLFSNQSGTQNLNAHCGEIRIYNREIITPEFTQNYNATRGRYGV